MIASADSTARVLSALRGAQRFLEAIIEVERFSKFSEQFHIEFFGRAELRILESISVCLYGVFVLLAPLTPRGSNYEPPHPLQRIRLRLIVKVVLYLTLMLRAEVEIAPLCENIFVLMLIVDPVLFTLVAHTTVDFDITIGVVTRPRYCIPCPAARMPRISIYCVSHYFFPQVSFMRL
jgi:hypothetical protein